jgi:hypothetical protein
MIDDDLETYLGTITSLSVYWDLKPKGVTDCIILNRVSPMSINRNSSNKTVVYNFQVDVYSDDKDTAKTNADLIVQSLDGNITDFGLATLSNGFDLAEKDSALWRCYLLFNIQ